MGKNKLLSQLGEVAWLTQMSLFGKQVMDVGMGKQTNKLAIEHDWVGGREHGKWVQWGHIRSIIPVARNRQ